MKTYTFNEAEESFRQYPYYIYPALSALAGATQEQRAILVRRIAAAIGDEAALRTAIGIDPTEFADFYPDMKAPELSTSETIDTFISTFSTEKKSASPEIEEIVAAPAIDYAAMLAAEDDSEPLPGADSDSTADLLNSFLGAKPKPSAPAPKPAAPVRKPIAEPATRPAVELEENPTETHAPDTSIMPGNESNLSEALLKVMVKKGNYSKALEIINELSLNNPKKSIYFADQKRFLKKLMLNRERLDGAKKE